MRWSFQITLYLVAFIAVSILIDRVLLRDGHIKALDKNHFTYNHNLALQNELYPACSNVDNLIKALHDYKKKLSGGIHELQLRGEIWCGVQRESIFSKRRVPWTGCEKHVDASKLELLSIISKMCDDQKLANQIYDSKNRGESFKLPSDRVVVPRTRPFKRGIVYTGAAKHFKQIYTSLLSLVRVQNTLPVEVFTDIPHVKLCTRVIASYFERVSCHALPRNIAGFAAKFYSTALSSFSEALFIDADTIVLRNPLELFELPEFKTFGSVWWPDLWGEQCRLDKEVPYGETAFRTHIIYQAEIMGLQWSNIRNVSHEAETFLFVLDLNRHMPLLDLSIYLVEDEFFYKLFYGDKDVMRLVHFFTGLPFYLNPQIPASAMLMPSLYRDSLVHFAGDNPAPFIFHQLKSGQPEAFRHIYRLKAAVKDDPSFCIPASHVTNSAMFEELTMENAQYDAEAHIKLVASIYNESSVHWANNAVNSF